MDKDRFDVVGYESQKYGMNGDFDEMSGMRL